MGRTKLSYVICLFLGPALISAAFASNDKGRLPVPAWKEFDGKKCGDLALSETTRGAFQAKYAHSKAERREVLRVETQRLAHTDVFLIFDGSRSDAKLRWIVCLYENPKEAPQPAELMGHAKWTELQGEELSQRAGWRIFAAPERGLAGVAEAHKDGYIVTGLIMGEPERMAAVAGRMQQVPTSGSLLTPGTDRTPIPVMIGEPHVEVNAEAESRVDAERLRRAAAQAAGDAARSSHALRIVQGSEGRLGVLLELESREAGDMNRIVLSARASLDAESDGMAIHARSPLDRRTLDGASTAHRIQDEARKMVDRGVRAVSHDAEEQLRRDQNKLAGSAQRRVRPALLDFLVGGAR